MNDNIIITNILNKKNYFTTLIGKIESSDFRSFEAQNTYDIITEMYNEYNKIPNIDELKTYISTKNDIKSDIRLKLVKYVEKELTKETNIDYKILLDATQKYIKDSRFESLIEKSIMILEGENKKDNLSTIQSEMEKVIQFNFDTDIGHDYFRDYHKRFEAYGKVESGIVRSGIEIIDKAIGGRGSLNIFLSPSDVGKTLYLASWATRASIDGYNVAVFTMEDREEDWSSRIDQNLMNKTKEEIREQNVNLSNVFKQVVSDNMGTIKIKEFPYGITTVNDFKKVLQDWKLNCDFEPEALFVDYLGIMASKTRTSSGYEKGSNVAQELRSLAQELNIPINSAVQARRDVFGADTMDMSDVADSIGIAQTANCIIGIIDDSEEASRQILAILKSKQLNKKKMKPTIVNVSTDYQRVWDTNENLDYRKLKKDSKKHVKETLETMENIVEMSENESDLLSDILKGNY